MRRGRLTGVLWALKWFFIVCLLVLSVDILYVLWPYPNGPRGVAALKANLATEVELIGRLADAQSWAISERSTNPILPQ